MDHMSKQAFEDTCTKLWKVSGSLKGIGGLFTQGTKDISISGDEFYGVGLLLKKLSDELEAIEAFLRNERPD